MSGTLLARPRTRWLRVTAAASTAAIAAVALVFAAPAFSFSAHRYSTTFSGSGADALSEPSGIAVDNSSGGEGDIYVADTGNHRVEKFTASGEFILMFGEEVNKTAVETAGREAEENICPAAGHPSDVCQAAVSSALPGGFEAPSFVAVDSASGNSAGDVYVGDIGNHTVTKFDASGHLLSSWGDGGRLHIVGSEEYNNLVGIAVETNGDLLAMSGRFAHLYEEGGIQLRSFPAPAGNSGVGMGLGVDTENNFYGEESNESVSKFTDTGKELALPVTGTFGKVGLTIDPSSNDLYLVLSGGYVNRFAFNCGYGCTPIESFGSGDIGEPSGLSPVGISIAASTGTIYVANTEAGSIAIFRAVTVPDVTTGPVETSGQRSGKLTGKVDPDSAHGGGQITECFFEYGETAEYGQKANCEQATPLSGAETVTADASSLTPETTYHYRLVAGNANGTHAGEDLTFTPHAVAELSTEPAVNITQSAAQLVGSFSGNGEDTHFYFQWGTTAAYGNETGHQDAGSEVEPERPSEAISGLESATKYHFRLVAENSAGATYGGDQSFTTLPDAPVIGAESVSEVHSDAALVHVHMNPGGGVSSYHVEYVEDEKFKESGFAGASQSPSLETGATKGSAEFTAHLSALSQATTYHYRVVATNADDQNAPVQGTVRTFTTLPFIPSVNDKCPNAHVRQQTGAAQLMDCRAYELVSAANTGGYDVESNVVPGQSPFAGYPEAQDRVLYGVHNGGIPGTDHPTNRGLDPYVATRGTNGWSTEYVGIPANDPEASASAPFSSTPTAADADLETFSFGAPGGCSPCFSGSYTGIPIRKPNGELTQGMAGPENPGPSAAADGHIAKPLSANGEHFIFGSTSRFARGGNDETGDVSIYDRNLATGETHVVSNTPKEGEDGPEPLSCLQGAGQCHSPGDTNGIAELDVSANGSHILLGQKVTDDSEGHAYYHLYMEVGDSIHSIDLTPEVVAKPEGEGFKEGVLFAGMSADGSKVFFTTKDPLYTATNQDTDHSTDLYVAEIAGQSATLTRISTGIEGTGNTDSCDPSANTVHEHWNVLGSEENCSAVAIGGGGGVAMGDGTAYFLSPEKLDGSGNGVQNAPNLYVARPEDRYVPKFVTTLESSSNASLPAREHPFVDSFGFYGKGSPDATAIDLSDGDIYVLNDAGGSAHTGGVEKYNSAGNPIGDFGEGGELDGSESADGRFSEESNPRYEADVPVSIAVDNTCEILGLSGSACETSDPSNGDLYVPDTDHGVVDKFDPSGHIVSEINLHGAYVTGVSVDQANGNVYVSSENGISIYGPTGLEISTFATIKFPISVAAGSNGDAYVLEGGQVDLYSAGVFVRHIDTNRSHGVAVDPSDGHVYVDEGNQVSEFESSGSQVGGAFGSGMLAKSYGLSADAGRVFASNPGSGNVVTFGPLGVRADPETDNPVVLDSVSTPETRHTADFQVSPNGEFAVFPSTLPLAAEEEETADHQEVYRYDAQTAKLFCVSCTTTGAPSAGDSSLAADGLSILNDGRVFFNSADQLVSADTDGKQDVYEFSEPGIGTCNKESTAFDKATSDCLALVSAGTSPFDSGLLSASSNGKDVFFFTRDSLAPQDKNGATMKIYDAREGGGFPYLEPAQQCQASDECHGPSSSPPPPVEVGSVAGTGNNAPMELKCRKGTVLRRGGCVKRHKHKSEKPHNRASHKRGRS